VYEYIRRLYGTAFSAADLPGFVAAGWLTEAEADEIKGGS